MQTNVYINIILRFPSIDNYGLAINKDKRV